MNECGVPVTVIVAAKNEEKNLKQCLDYLKPAKKVFVLDSHSNDRTSIIGKQGGVEVVQFEWNGGYPKKRQWALDNLAIPTEWVFMVDADEKVPENLWAEIEKAINNSKYVGFFIKKEFHFMGKRMRFGGLSHKAILLFRKGKGRFEELGVEEFVGLDMEVHERVVVDGPVGKFKTAIIHQDYKGYENYIDKHNKYSSWEAMLRAFYLKNKRWGNVQVCPKIFGNIQEKRRSLKAIAVRIPFEGFFWFLYHYFFMLGFLEGRRGFIACMTRAFYIFMVNAKLYAIKKSQ